MVSGCRIPVYETSIKSPLTAWYKCTFAQHTKISTAPPEFQPSKRMFSVTIHGLLLMKYQTLLVKNPKVLPKKIYVIRMSDMQFYVILKTLAYLSSKRMLERLMSLQALMDRPRPRWYTAAVVAVAVGRRSSSTSGGKLTFVEPRDEGPSADSPPPESSISKAAYSGASSGSPSLPSLAAERAS